MPDFESAIDLDALVKFGERPSLFDFIPASYRADIRNGTMTDDLTTYIQDGLYSLRDAAGYGGGRMYVPWGVYPVRDLDIPSGIELVGDGSKQTILRRHSTLPSGRGVLNMSGVGSGVSRLAIDGGVTTPVGLLYSDMVDPMDDAHSLNSSIWIGAGAVSINISSIRIFHTGGYAIVMDAQTGHIYRVNIRNSEFENNRPNLAGPDAGSRIYGAWAGGIHYQGDGSSYAVHNLTVDKCHFRRSTGNQVWGHLYGFDALHSDINTTNCTFEDIGRDGVLVGGVTGGVVSDCRFRRIGYVCTDDASAGVPRWISGQWAVGLDTSGLVRGVNYLNNSFLNCLGAAIDADGLSECQVSGNTARVSLSTDPEYDEDDVDSWPGNYCYGIQIGNTSATASGAKGVSIIGNRFFNMGLGAIRAYAARECTIRDNPIWHPAVTGYQPIILGNAGTSDNLRAYGNSVSGNDIHWDPASAAPAIYEDATLGDFEPTDKNWIAGNNIFGANCYEFRKHATSGSVTGVVLSSQKDSLAAESINTWQREDGYTRMYRNSDTFLTVLDQFAIVGGNAGPLLNISHNAVGGVLATGARTSSAFNDSVVTGKLAADGFVSLTNSTFLDAEADLLADTYGLLRYDATAKKFQLSTSVALGARVWTDLAAAAAGSSGQVQYNGGSGAFAASSNFAWSNASKVLTVTGATGTASIVAATSFIQSAEGFYSPGTAADTVNIPGGGVTALSVISIRNDADPGIVFARSSSVARVWGFGVNSSGHLFLKDLTAGSDRLKIDLSGTLSIGSTVLIDQTGNISATATVAAAGLSASGSSYNSIQAPSGGLYAGLGLTADQSLYLKSFASATMNTPAGGYGGLSHKTGTQYWVYNGSSWVTIDLSTVGGGVTSITGTTNQVIASASTGAVVLSLPQSIHTGAGPTFATLTISSSASNAIAVTGSVAAAGFSASGSATNQIQVASGGVTGKYLVATTSLTVTADSAANAGLSASTQGRIYFDSTSNKFRVSEHGGAYVDLLGGSGVTSITGTTNQVVASASTGAVTLSLPQSIHTGAGPTFATLTISSSASNAIAVTGSVAAAGFSASGSATNQIQVASGGVTGKYLVATTSLTVTADSAANAGLSASTQGRLYFDSTSNKFRVSENGGAYIDLIGGSGVTSITGTTNQVVASASTGAVTLSLPQSIHTGAGPTFATLTISSSASNAIAVTGSVAAAGLAASGSAYNSIQAPSGGLYAGLGLTADQSLYLKSFASATMNTPAGGYGGLSHKTGTQYWVYNGSSWATIDFATIGGGVTSITGTTNQVVASASTGAVVLSLPQSIHTGAGPTFATLTISSSASNAIAVTGSVAAAGLAASGSAYNSIQAPSGGLYAGLGLTADQSLYLKSFASATMNTPAGGYGGLSHKTGTQYWVYNGSSWVTIDLSTVGGGVTSITGTTNQVIASASTGAVTLSLPQSIATSSSVVFGTLQVQSASSDSQVYVSSAAPRVGLGNHATYASRTLGTRYVMASANGDYGLPTAGDAWIFTEGLSGGTAGSIYLGANFTQFVRITPTQMVVAGTSGVAGINVTGGYISSAQGFATASTAYDSIQTANGVLAKQLTFLSKANPGASTSGNAVIYMDSTSNALMVSVHGGAFTNILAGATQWTTSGSDIYYTAGQVRIGDSASHIGATLELTNAVAVNIMQMKYTGSSGPGSGGGIQSHQGSIPSGADHRLGFLVFGAEVSGTAYNRVAISAFTGQAWSTGSAEGAYLQFATTSNSSTTRTARWRVAHNGHWLTEADNSYDIGASGATRPRTLYLGTSLGIGIAPSVPLHVAGHTSNEVARFQGASDASNARKYISLYTTNPSYWWDISSEDASGGGTANGIAFRERSGSGSSLSRIYFEAGGAILIGTQTNDSSGAKLQVTGFVRTTTGFATPSTAYDSIQTANGFLGKQLTILSKANPGTSSAGNAVMYMDSTSNQLMLSVNGGAFSNLQATAGVSSITGTSNQVIASASTGSVTLSLPQSIHSGANFAVATVTTSGVVQSTATGATIAFQTSNGNFQVDGSGNISGAGSANLVGGYKVNATTVIDSSRNGTLASLTTSGAVHSTVTGASIGLQVNSGQFQVDGNGNVSGAGSTNFTQGYRVSGNTIINSSGQFVGFGVNVGANGISAGGYNVNGGYSGQTMNVVGTFTISGVPYTTLIFRGGVLVGAS